MKNNLRQIELIVYRLKRQYGLPIIVRKPTKNDNDVQTGKITREYATFKVRKAIVLPADLMRTFIYDLTYVAANKNFAYGGLFDKTMKVFIIDKKDIRDDDNKKVALDMACDIVLNTKKFDFVSIEETEDQTSYLIKAKNLDATPIIIDP
jgi:hypothetical protein